MNKRFKYISLAVVRVATVMLFITISLYTNTMEAAKNKKQSQPDFAYPQTVVKNADRNLAAAVTADDWQKVTLALIQKLTASNLVSHDSISENLKILESYIAKAPETWRPALQLIEADIYNTIYNSFRWEADQRQLPEDTVPQNPYDWSRDIFADKILALCRDVSANKANEARPIKEWSEILTDLEFALKYGMTVDEFLWQKCCSLLNVYSSETDDVIPFFGNSITAATPGQKCRELRDTLIDRLIEMTSARGQNIMEAFFLKRKADFMPYSLRQSYLMSAFEKLKSTEGSQLILSELESNVVANDSEEHPDFILSRQQYADLLQQSIKQFPNGQYVNALRNILTNYTNPSINIEYRSQYLTSSDISMDVTMHNSNEAYVLVYDYSKYKNAKETPNNKTLAATCRLIKAIKIKADGTVPFSEKTIAEIGSLPVGTYVVIPSATPTGNGIYASIAKQTWHQPFTVSDISVVSFNNLDNTSRVLVVDGKDGHPIAGAKVNVFTRANYNSGRIWKESLITDKDGCVKITEKNCEVEASHNGSIWSNFVRIYNTPAKLDTAIRHHVSILTDRSIYHPGDSINAVFIAYISKNVNLNLDKGQTYKIDLCDANGKAVACQSATADSNGRAEISFKIPEEGLLGNWSLRATDEKDKSFSYAYFQVADYVAPTFFITSENTENEVTAGDVVNLKGQVLTYSGMPVANANVNFTVNYRPPMRWWAPSNATYDSSVTTDQEGKYVISLPTANLKDTQFERGVFTVNVTATSPEGETQSGPSSQFGLGQEYTISTPASGMYFDISDSIPPIIFNVRDIMGNNVKKKLKYILKEVATGEISAEGWFDSPSLILPNKSYASAKYDLNVSLSDDTKVKSEISFVFWRKSDTEAPAGIKLWIPRTDFYATPDEFKTYVTIGSGVTDRWIPILLSGSNKVIEFKWLHVVKENQKVPVVLPKGRERFIMDVNYISDLDIENSQINFYGLEESDKLEISTESFRDRISAGDDEHWKFRFVKKYGKVNQIPVLAVMTDAALSHLVPFKWNFTPTSNANGQYAFFRNDMDRYKYMDFNLKNSKYLSYQSLYFPSINNYSHNWGLHNYLSDGLVYANAETLRNEVFIRGTGRAINSQMKMSSGAAADFAAVEEEAFADDALILEEPAVTGCNDNGYDNVELRESECPLAFFMPGLVTNEDGVVDLNFTVPNFNTTWALQMLGYDEELQTAYKQLETVASKPVMVTTHSPRFVRTSDAVQLTATIFNNTQTATEIKGRMELVNLMDDKIIASKEFDPESVTASGSRVITMPWTVPSDISMIGLRAYAEANGHRDGEQVLLPVLPASSPVVESTPFWLPASQREFEVRLPKYKETDQVTLQYCSNPAWYCLSALPDLLQVDSKSALINSANLFCNATAYNLISSNLSLKQGLSTLLSDKNSHFAALKSNLEKDGNLKLSKLSETPWVNDAESETLRMSRLSSLLDDASAMKTITDQITGLKKLQTPEGGWSWCPDMQPSTFITQLILHDFSMMSSNGAIKCLDGADEMIRSAIGYVDSETLKDFRKHHKKGESLSYLLGWLYDRSRFAKDLLPVGKTSKELAPVYAKAIKDIESEWKSLDIKGKATAAMLLWRHGKQKTATDILESLREYASRSEEKGIWFDNLRSGIMGASSLQTTATVLDAFTEILPQDMMVDGLRQWLIMSRQMQDWGKNRFNVMVVNSILTSGTDWTNDSVTIIPDFRLGSKSIDVSATAALTGAFTLNLNARDASGKKLEIKRSCETPAWGGVISQYEAPMKDVAAVEIPELTIRKNIVALVDDGNGVLVAKEGIALKKGMKVRVTLTVVNDRDMEYMEIKDERSACLEPADQLSGYTSSDGVWYYEEVRTNDTNIFIEYLPKGHHVISYDCTVSQDGVFSCGIATIQSQYSPLLTSHTAASLLHVK